MGLQNVQRPYSALLGCNPQIFALMEAIHVLMFHNRKSSAICTQRWGKVCWVKLVTCGLKWHCWVNQSQVCADLAAQGVEKLPKMGDGGGGGGLQMLKYKI